MLRCASGIVKCQSDWNRDEIDIGNVGEQLGVIVGEFAKAPHDVDVGVCRIVGRGLDQGAARTTRSSGIEKEGQWSTDGEPDSSASNVWNDC